MNNNNSESEEEVRRKSYDEKNYESGIIRKKKGNDYEYFYVKNNKPVSKSDMERIKKLKIPPMWNSVWVSGDKNSSIQVVGLDKKNKKQYIYHQHHIAKAEKEKFIRLYKFIKAMPKLDQALKENSKLPDYSLKRVIVTMLTLVKELHIRVGKEQYARENKSYGISSLKKSHIKIEGDYIKLRFRGKSKQNLSYTFLDPVVRKHIQSLLKLEGEKIFQYVEDDKIKRVTDMDLNHYIKENMGSDFTVKDFRTYAANLRFVKSILGETQKRLPKDNKTIKKNITNAIQTTAHHLRHTKSISKKSYIMNFTIELYQNNPEYFVKRKYDDPEIVLLDLLKAYKQTID